MRLEFRETLSVTFLEARGLKTPRYTLQFLKLNETEQRRKKKMTVYRDGR